MSPRKRKAFPFLWYSKKLRFLFNCVVIIAFGIFSGFILCHYSLGSCTRLKRCDETQTSFTVTENVAETEQIHMERTNSKSVRKRRSDTQVLGGSIFVGVMTAKKYLDTRTTAVHRTWAAAFPGKVEFFSNIPDNDLYGGMPIVSLPYVSDNMYPPQKKSFMMLKYMYEKYIDKYEWFVRADDDVFINGEKLAKFLHSVNSSKPYYIGQAGQGLKSEVGKLSLKSDENFCMGGTTMILSRETLRQMGPHISYCLKHLYTMHEDVEVGRCVRTFVKVQCTWAFEMQSLFYQNHEEPKGSYTRQGKLDELPSALTLHPVKDSRHLYRIHNHFRSKKIQDLNNRILGLRRSTHLMNELVGGEQDVTFSSKEYLAMPLSLTKYKSRTREDIIPWSFFQRYIYKLGEENPKEGLPKSNIQGLNKIIRRVMRLINKNARQRGRTIDYKDVLYGYSRVNPLYGADYVIDLLLVYRKLKGKRITVNVRRHAYLQQSFTEPQVLVHDLDRSVTHHSSQLPSLKRTTTVHFILPLAGRFESFQRFLNNYETQFLRLGDDVSLAVILFSESSQSRTNDVIRLVHNFKLKYPSHDLRVVRIKGAFSRAVGLNEGSSLYQHHALLFFIDVDILINSEAVGRIRTNTVEGSQVYLPIVFSQYSPQVTCPHGSCSKNPFLLSKDHGYWRFYGFGMISIYKGDLDSVGGLDTKIEGWGTEDIKLCDRIVIKKLHLFRSVDPGMVHIFHQKFCDRSLSAVQYDMCQSSGARGYASQEYLANLVYRDHRILNRDFTVANSVISSSTNVKVPSSSTKPR